MTNYKTQRKTAISGGSLEFILAIIFLMESSGKFRPPVNPQKPIPQAFLFCHVPNFFNSFLYIVLFEYMTKAELMKEFEELQKEKNCQIEGIYWNSRKDQIQKAIDCLKCPDNMLGRVNQMIDDYNNGIH